MRLVPTFLQARANLGRVYHLQNRPGEAIAEYQRALADHPDEGGVYALLGGGNMALSQYAEARAAYRRAVELGVETAGAFYDLGVISEQEGKLEAARSYFHQALLKNAAHADSYHRLGAVTAKLGHEEQAATYYLEAIKRDPGHAGAHYSLAQLYLKQGRSDEGQRANAGLCQAQGIRGTACQPQTGREPVAAHPGGHLQLGDAPPRVRICQQGRCGL